MSADGDVVALRTTDAGSDAIRLWDRTTGRTTLLVVPGSSPPAALGTPAVSADGDVVVFTASGGTVGPGIVADGHEFFRYEVGSGVLERVAVPGDPVGAVEQVSVSADGTTIAVSTDHQVLTWTRAGFRNIADDPQADISIQAPSLSPDGRYLTVLRTVTVATDPTVRHADFEVLDLATGTRHATWVGPTWQPGAPSAALSRLVVVATTDRGELIFGSRWDGETLLLDGARTEPLGGGAPTAGSWSGRWTAYSGNPELVPPWEAGISWVLDRQLGTRSAVGGSGSPASTVTLAISDDGTHALLRSSDLAFVAQPGLYVWNRGA
jgi:WD40 repeat protein